MRYIQGTYNANGAGDVFVFRIFTMTINCYINLTSNPAALNSEFNIRCV